MLRPLSHILLFKGYLVWLATAQWTTTIPKTVAAVEGSCVVIPCSFDHPNAKSEIKVWKPYWKESNTEKTIYSSVKHAGSNHMSNVYTHGQFHNRTSMPGNIEKKNCSLEIDRVQKKDSSSYYFRIEMPKFNNFSFIGNIVRISVKAEPEPPSLSKVKKEVNPGESVTVSCSVSHSCPPHLPQISWNHNGHITVQSEPPTEGQQKLTSNLTFNATASDHQNPITCNVQFHGGKTANKSFSFTVRNFSGPVIDDKKGFHTTTHAQVITEEENKFHTTPDHSIQIVPVVVSLVFFSTAILGGLLLYRKQRRKQTMSCHLNTDKCRTGQSVDMSDEVYANAEVITSGKDVGDEDIYANTEFLQTTKLELGMNPGAGCVKEPDDDIYANM